MEFFMAKYFALIVEGMQHEINLFGFKFSMWSVLIFTAIADIIVCALRRFFYD